MINMDQADREGPLNSPMSAADERAQEAYEKAEDDRRVIDAMAEEFANRAVMTANARCVPINVTRLKSANGNGVKFRADLTESFSEVLGDDFDLPSPDDAADRARAAE